MWSYVPLEQRIPTAPRSRGARGHGYDSADLSGPRHSVSATGAEARPPADEAVREGGARRKRPGGRQVREDRGPLGLSIHRPGRLHALSGPAAVPTVAPGRQRGVPGRAPAGAPLPDSEAAVRQRPGVPARLRAGGGGGGQPASVHPAAASQENGKVERSHRIDQEEFWGRHRFTGFDAAATALRTWERTYNYQRFSLALQGRTPAEKLAGFPPAPCCVITLMQPTADRDRTAEVNLDETQQRRGGQHTSAGPAVWRVGGRRRRARRCCCRRRRARPGDTGSARGRRGRRSSDDAKTWPAEVATSSTTKRCFPRTSPPSASWQVPYVGSLAQLPVFGSCRRCADREPTSAANGRHLRAEAA